MLRRLWAAVFRRPAPPPAPPPSADYAGDREADRVGRLSPEDREWEAASLRRHRDNQARDEQAGAEAPPRA